jgi:hypothetical protein
MRRCCRLFTVAAGLGLAGCLPVLQVVPERLSLRYPGPEAASVEMNCANTNEFMFIQGPDDVRLRISPKYLPDRRLVILQMTLVAFGRRQAMLEPQEVALAQAGGGVIRTVSIRSVMTAPAKLYDFDVRIDELPAGPIRLGMPAIRIGADTWQPAELELQPMGRAARPMPFNC